MIADKIKSLREECGYTQASLAKELGITRAGVNAWEMGISIPSTQYIIKLAGIFKVSTDYLLGVTNTVTLDVSGLEDKDIELIHTIITHLRNKEVQP